MKAKACVIYSKTILLTCSESPIPGLSTITTPPCEKTNIRKFKMFSQETGPFSVILNKYKGEELRRGRGGVVVRYTEAANDIREDQETGATPLQTLL